MTYIPYAPEIGAFYTITGPDGSVATFNNALDANYAGVLSDISGLDSPNVNDGGGDLVQADGGYLANNYYGRRPITLTGTIYNFADTLGRNTQMARIRSATNAMTADGTLSWLNTASGSVQMSTTFRRQQPVRFTGGFVKTFNIAIVSSIAPLMETAYHTSANAASITVENRGDYTIVPDEIHVYGPTSGTLVITNTTTGRVVQMIPGFTLSAGQELFIYPPTHSAVLTPASTIVNSSIDFVFSNWFGLVTGNNTITTSSGTVELLYRSAWV